MAPDVSSDSSNSVVDHSSSPNCMRKVTMTERTVLSRRRRCLHSLRESCFTSYHTVYRPQQVNDIFDRVAIFLTRFLPE